MARVGDTIRSHVYSDPFLMQLSIEVDSHESALWRVVMKEINTLIEGNVVKSPSSASSESSHAASLYKIRYHDCRNYFIDEKRFEANGYSLKMGYIIALRSNYHIERLSLTEKYDFEQDARSYVAACPGMHTLFLIESAESVKKHGYIISVFLTLSLFQNISEDKPKYAICLIALFNSYYKVIGNYFKKTKKANLKIALERELQICRDYVTLNDLSGGGWNVDVHKLTYLLKNELWKYLESTLKISNSKETRNCYDLILSGKWYLQQFRDMAGIPYFVNSITHSTSLWTLTLALRYLSELCFDLDRSVLALRLLNTAHRYCTLYKFPITPSFVNRIYFEQKRKILRELNGTSCSYCNEKVWKLMCCTGCMKTTYCSRSCQKKHWRLNHRTRCNKEWLTMYQILKESAVFDVSNRD